MRGDEVVRSLLVIVLCIVLVVGVIRIICDVCFLYNSFMIIKNDELLKNAIDNSIYLNKIDAVKKIYVPLTIVYFGMLTIVLLILRVCKHLR